MKERHAKLFRVLAAQIPSAPRATPWQPAADVYRTDGGWLVKLDLAGVDPDDVELVLSGNRITARGDRRDVEVTRTVRTHSMEIPYSRFERSIDLPSDLANAEVKVDSRNGMLLIWLMHGFTR